MDAGVFFWVLMIVWFCFGAYNGRDNIRGAFLSGDLVLFILLALLGWKVFGPIIK